MSAFQRIQYVLEALKWALFSDQDPIQERIDACKSSVYECVRKARDARRISLRESLRDQARIELRQIEKLETERLRLLWYSLIGLSICFGLILWITLLALV